jgi:hypothetical protein
VRALTTLGAGAAALALALAAAGCGGDEAGSDSFKEDYQAESAKIERIGRDIAAAVGRAPRKSEADLARRFADLAGRARDSAAALEKLDPPEELADERDNLADAVERGSDDLRDVATALSASDAKGGAAAGRALTRDSGEIGAARRKLDRLAAKE